jgi:nitrate reductase NapE
MIKNGPIDKERSAMTEEYSKTEERRAFLLLVVFLAPFLSVVIVGGYGFLVWISQILLGPPGA